MNAVVGILGLVGAAMLLGGAAGAGALLGAYLMARHRLHNSGRLAFYGLLTAALLVGGAGLTRPEARVLVGVFASVPFLVGWLFAVVDLRRAR